MNTMKQVTTMKIINREWNRTKHNERNEDYKHNKNNEQGEIFRT